MICAFLGTPPVSAEKSTHQSGYSQVVGRGGPLDVDVLLEENDRHRESVFELPGVDAFLQPWFDFKAQLNERIVIQGAEGPEFTKALYQTGEPFSVHKLEKEIVAAAQKIVKRDKNIDAILLECTELPPAAYAVQDAFRLPVWDYTTPTKWIHDGCLRRPFTGII
jgi:hypothetical protein